MTGLDRKDVDKAMDDLEEVRRDRLAEALLLAAGLAQPLAARAQPT